MVTTSVQSLENRSFTNTGAYYSYSLCSDTIKVFDSPIANLFLYCNPHMKLVRQTPNGCFNHLRCSIHFRCSSFYEGNHIFTFYHSFITGRQAIRLRIAGPASSMARELLERYRTLSVKCNESFSVPLKVLSGVPQVFHLGPLLFNIFMIDIGTVILGSNFLLFADGIVRSSKLLLHLPVTTISTVLSTRKQQLVQDECYGT